MFSLVITWEVQRVSKVHTELAAPTFAVLWLSKVESFSVLLREQEFWIVVVNGEGRGNLSKHKHHSSKPYSSMRPSGPEGQLHLSGLNFLVSS